MSNIQSYNALIDRFKAFASGHFILKRFSHGQIEVSDLEKFGEYPFMHVIPSNVTYSQGMKTFSFQIVLADLPRDKEDKSEYQREALSDLQRIAEDLIAEITNHRVLFGDLITVNNVSLEPFLEEFQHTLTGWTVSLDLLVPYYWDACSIPAEWNDFFESSTGGTGSILTFIDSITRDENGNVSLVNDEAEPSPNYYYGTNDEGVRGWYLLTDEIGLTCETIGDCQTIIDIESAIDDLQEEILLKANTADISAVGFSNDYNDLDNKPTIPTGTVTSVGLTMPSAFSVANSPITTSGDIAVTGAGTVSQYVRGDGSLATFPSSTGGGASVSYYLNGSVSQGTFGGVAFREMDRTPILGAGTDFTIATNGYIQSFITDANVPNQLEIPAGNWNFETYFSASSNGGTPSYYIELYKWDGATLSLIASGSANPEGITNGTATHLYVSAIAVPQTTLALTDRLAVRIWVNNSGRTIKLHTENSNLSQVITTFSTGLTALNGLTAQVQNFATGTAGTDFGISSATSTHTFNLPTASAVNRGALSSADWTTFNGKFNLPALTSGSVLFSNGTTIAQDNANFFWDDTNNRLGIGTATPAYGIDVNGTARISGTFNNLTVTNQGGATPALLLEANRSGWFQSISIKGGTTVLSTKTLLLGQYDDGNALIFNQSAADIIFSTNSTERFRLKNSGNLLINTTTDAGFKLDVNGTARVQGALTVGSGSLSNSSLLISRGITGSTNVSSVLNTSVIQADVTFAGSAFTSQIGTQNTTFTLTLLRHFSALQGAIGAGSIVSNQYGFHASSGLVSAQNNFGFRGEIPAGATNWNLYMSGTANNYLAGNLLIGTTTDAGYRLDVNGGVRFGTNFIWDNTNGYLGIKRTPGVEIDVTGSIRASAIVFNSTTQTNNIQTNNQNLTVKGASSVSYITMFQSTGNLLLQNGGTFTDIASARLAVNSTTQGFLPPRMTTTQKNAITSPATGLMVYDTTLNLISVYNGTMWISL